MSRRLSIILAGLMLVLVAGVGVHRYLDNAAVDRRAAFPEARFPGETAPDWPTYGGQPSGTQYSSLDQINLKTIADLQPAWTFRTGDLSDGSDGGDMTNYQVTPILAEGKLLLCTPYNNIIALNPATGEKLWRFDFGKPRTETMYGYHNCRGVAYWASDRPEDRGRTCARRVLMGTDNGFLVAVDAADGKPCGDFGKDGRIDLNAFDYRGDGNISMTSPPAIYRDVVIVGGTVIDNRYADSLDGIVRGFDIRTGRELWSWNPIPAALSDKVGGANAWAPLSIDHAAGVVFLPTGSPSYDTLGINRIDAIPDGNAVIALDALTGEKRWSFQTVHHDLWDYDLPSMPTLVTLHHEGKAIPAVIQATKTGFVFTLDRRTGKPIHPVEERPVPASDVPGEKASPTQPFPVRPEPFTSQSIKADDAAAGDDLCRDRIAAYRNEGIFTPPSIKGSILHPSFLGGSNWGGIAYDQRTGVAVVNSSNLVSRVTLMPRDVFDPAKHKSPGVSTYEMRGSPYVMLREALFSRIGTPCNPPPWGALTAIDMNSGAIVWQRPFGKVEFAKGVKSPERWGAPNQGGPIITAGGLIFIGASLDSRLRAFDLATGEEVWSASTPAPATATPMTYMAGGRQFVVVAAGGHGAFGTRLSDAIVAFALP